MRKACFIVTGLLLLLLIVQDAAAGPKPGGCSRNASGGISCAGTTGFEGAKIPDAPGSTPSPPPKACNWDEQNGCATFDACWNEYKAKVDALASQAANLQHEICDSWKAGKSSDVNQKCDALQALSDKAKGYVGQMSDLALDCKKRGKPLPPTDWLGVCESYNQGESPSEACGRL